MKTKEEGSAQLYDTHISANISFKMHFIVYSGRICNFSSSEIALPISLVLGCLLLC